MEYALIEKDFGFVEDHGGISAGGWGISKDVVVDGSGWHIIKPHPGP